MLFLPEILTWFFFKIGSPAGGFFSILEPWSQFFHRLLQLHQLLSLRPSSLVPAVLLCLVLVLILYLYVLVLTTSPGLFSGSWPPPRWSFSRWRKPVMFAVLPLCDLALFTWFLNLMVPGDPVGISDVSTWPLFLTDTFCPPLRISPPG